MDIITYFEQFRAMKKVVEELNQSVNGHAVVEILCREQNISADGLSEVEKTKFIAGGQKRILGMHFLMNANHNKFGARIKDYDRQHLSRNDKYPKTLQDAYSLLEGQNKHKSTGQKYPPKVGISFNTIGEGRERVRKGLSMTEQSIHHTAGVVVPTTHWTSAFLKSTPMEQCCIMWRRLKRRNMG